MNSSMSRLKNVRQRFSHWDVDAILVSNATNRRWLSGFSGSSGRLLITAGEAILATDSRYWEQARAQAPDFDVFQDHRRHEDTVALIRRSGAVRIGLEAHNISVAEASKLESIEGIIWVALEEPIEPLRQVKTNDEITAIRRAAAITDQVMTNVHKLVVPGISERTLAWELEKAMRDAGADGMAFPIIVAFGPNSAHPHHQPGDRILQADDIILVDMGAERDGYKSDLTRTFFLGPSPDRKFQMIFDLVLSALNTTVHNIRPGINSRGAYELAMDVIAAGGHREQFGHGLGHGVGLDIHENPFLSSTRAAVELTVGMVITIEPGIYFPGWGGVRIEDLVLVSETGIEPLSLCPKKPLILT